MHPSTAQGGSTGRFTITLTTHTHTRTHTSDGGIDTAVKNSLVTEQVRLEGRFKRGGRIRVVECLSQTVPNRWASVRNQSFTKCFCVYMRGDKGFCVRCGL